MAKKIVITALLIFLIFNSGLSIIGPTRLYPAKNSIVTQLDAVFTWKPLTKPGVTYEVKIAEDSEFKVNTIQLRTINPTLKLSLPYLQKGKSYYWTVRALYNQNLQSVETSWSHESKRNTDHFQFSVNTIAKGFVGYHPVIAAPVHNSVLDTLQPEFEWLYPIHDDVDFEIMNTRDEWVSTKLTNIRYQLMISTSDDFSRGTKTFEITNESMKFTLTIPWLNKGTRYFWKVKAIYMDPEKGIIKESEWSATTDNSQLPSSFEIARGATGTFGFNEGMIEEKYDKDSLRTVTMITKETTNCFSPAVSKDRQKLAYCSDYLGQINIYEISLADQLSVSGLGIKKTSLGDDILCLNPFWLPGSSQVAFYTNRATEYFRLFHTYSGNVIRVLDENDSFGDPENFEFFGSCTSDGKIVFTVRTKANSPHDLYFLDLNRNDKVILSQGMFPDIGNDDRIVYSRNDPADPNNYDIYIGNLEANGIVNEAIITHNIKCDYDPVFSPDGTRIAFTSTRSGNSDIWVMDSDGENLRQITYHPLVDRRPQWINNESLVFQSNRALNDKNEPVRGIFKIDIPR